MDIIQNAKPYIPEDDRQSIMTEIEGVLASGMLMQGPYVERFERAFADFVGVQYARAVNSGTSALHAVLEYFAIQGKEVLVPVNTFLASANAIYFAGGTPVFVEMDPETLLLDVHDLERRMSEKTAGVMLVHLAGYIHPEIDRIRALCKEKKLFLIEDASHAAGSGRGGANAGALGDAGAFSLLATKVMTAGGEGGIVTTNNGELAERVSSLRFHGEDHTRGIQDRIGYSWRMTELQAIVGYWQVKRLPEIVEKRMAIARQYDEAFLPLHGVRPFLTPATDKNGYYKYPVELKGSHSRAEVRDRLLKEYGVKVGTAYWPPCHLQPAYRNRGYKEGDYPIAENVLDRVIALPMFCDLTQEQIGRVIEAVRSVCE